MERLVSGLSSFSGKVCFRLPPNEKPRARMAGIFGTSLYTAGSAMFRPSQEASHQIQVNRLTYLLVRLLCFIIARSHLRCKLD